MKIQYASDLHLEFLENREFLRENPLIPKGDILILAGDIVSEKARKKAEPFYETWRTQFKYIISIAGNHEYYGGEVMHAYPRYKRHLTENHVLLNNESVEIDGVRFIATTLWTNIPESKISLVESSSNDYRQIKYSKHDPDKRAVTAHDLNQMHAISLKFLEAQLNTPFSGQTIVITHHLPSYELLGAAQSIEIVKYYCASDLDRFIEKYSVPHWIVGHFHESIENQLYQTRFVSNPLGYVDEGQHKNFSTTAYFSVK